MKKIVVVTLALILVVLVAASCAAPAMDASTTAQAVPAEAPAAEEPMEAAGAYDSYSQEAVYEEADMAMDKAVEEEGFGNLPSATVPDTSRKLVYRASFEIDTKDFNKDYTQIKQALAGVQGYIENEDTSSHTTDYGSSRYASLTLRVPTTHYEEFLDTLSGVGEIKNKNISTDDITSQYFDTDARVEILEERRTRLMEHLRAATKTEDILQIESELSDVLYELDSYKGDLRHMDDMVEYTQINVSLNEVITAETISPTGDPLGDRAANAYNMSLTGVGNFLQDFAVGFAAAAPVLMLVAIIAAVTLVIVKLVQKMRKKMRAHRAGSQNA